MADLSKIKLNGVEYDLKDAIARAAINNGLKLQVVEELPSEDIDENTLYLVPRQEEIIHSETKEITSATQTDVYFFDIASNLNKTYSATVIITQTLNDATTELLHETINNVNFNITEVATIYEENNWRIKTTAQTTILISYIGDKSTWEKDSWQVTLILKENLSSTHLYSKYLYVNNSWEEVNEDFNNYMVKGADYVTAGQKSRSVLGLQATAEGNSTTASGKAAHAEGKLTTASGNVAHAEGQSTQANGSASHAEGSTTKANGDYSHAEGYNSQANGRSAHSEGHSFFSGPIQITGAANATTYNFTYTNNNTQPIVVGQTVRGGITDTVTTTITAIDKTNKTITFAKTFNSNNDVSSLRLHIDGHATGVGAHSEGYATTANKDGTHSEGIATVADGQGSHAEGYATRTAAVYTHAEGRNTTASGANSHAEGYNTIASGNTSHAEGGTTTASANGAHAEGGGTQASGPYSHSEGYHAIASGDASHAEGHTTTSSGLQSHSEGWSTVASGGTSHAEGQFTIAAKQSQHVFGEANIEDTATTTNFRGSYIEIVGNGTIDSSGDTPVVTRSNARTLDWSGNEWLAGKLTVGAAPVNDMDAATKQYVDSSIVTAISGITTFNATIVTDLPTTNIDTHTIYFKSNSSSGNNVYDEYMYINNNWELIGSTQIDLSNYLEKSKTQYGSTLGINYDGSRLANGFGESNKIYIGKNNEPLIELIAFHDLEANGRRNYNQINITANTTYGGGVSITGVVTPTSDTMAANKKYVDDSISAISVPTKTSDLTNDSGYITSYTETDPTVPAWAKAASKPTYTAAEVGALPDTTVIPEDKIFPVHVTLTSTSGGTSDKTHTEIFAAVNAGKIPIVYLSYASYSIIGILNHCNSTSANFTYINQTDTQVSFKYAQIKIVNDIASITSNVDVFALKDEIPTTTSQLTNDSGYITNADIPPIPTSTSNLINDSGFLTSIELADVATSGSYNDLVDTPTIPAAQVQSDWNATSGMGVILNKPTIPAATTVTNTLASGTLIATINGTNIYAPAYVDADGVSY